MNESQVAGLLVLLGVVGVLAAIAGRGIEAGPVKFPSIPRSRQKPLALASAVLIFGGALWLVVQQHLGGNAGSTTSKTKAGPTPNGTLRVVLIPTKSNVRIGEPLSVRSEVYDSNGQQLGSGQCALTWADSASNWHATTECDATISEPPASTADVHRIVAKAQGTGGVLATGTGSIQVTVSRT